jgi:hypothetical protein
MVLLNSIKRFAVFNNDTLLNGEAWIFKRRLTQPHVPKVVVVKS